MGNRQYPWLVRISRQDGRREAATERGVREQPYEIGVAQIQFREMWRGSLEVAGRNHTANPESMVMCFELVPVPK
jgi:hypothetical protein